MTRSVARSEAQIEAAMHVAPVEKGLRKGVIGGVASFATAVASTGPALVLATTVGVVVSVVGNQAIGVLLVAAVPMLMVARAFWELDVAERDCGTTFIWVGRALGPIPGFMSAWGQLGAGLLIVPGSAFVLSQYFLHLCHLDSLAGSTGWNLFIGLVAIAIIGGISYLGVEVAAAVQRLLVIIEILLVIMLVIVAIVKINSGEALHHAANFSPGWFNPFHGGFSDALVVAIFAYWGWDIAFTLGEESRGSETPGRASVYSIVGLVFVYLIGTIVFLMYAGPSFVSANGSTLLAAIGDSVLGKGLAESLITLAVLSSALAATQSTFVAGARLLLSMGAYKSLPRWFSKTNRRGSPVATIAIVLVGAAIFVVMTTLSTTVLFDSLSSTGLIICFYYGLTVFACAWRFRSTFRASFANALWRGIVPVLAGLILAAIFVKSAINFWKPQNSGAHFLGVGEIFWLAIGYLVLGVLISGLVAVAAKDFMSGRTMSPEFVSEAGTQRKAVSESGTPASAATHAPMTP